MLKRKRHHYMLKKAVKTFKSKMDLQYINFLNYRREFDITTYLTSKDDMPEIIWTLTRFAKFLRKPEFAKECIQKETLSAVKDNKTIYVFTEIIPKFLKQFQYNNENLPEYPVYKNEHLLKNNECAYFAGIPSKNIHLLIKNSKLPFYYLSFDRIDVEKDKLNPALLRYRLPELFFWINAVYDRLEENING